VVVAPGFTTVGDEPLDRNVVPQPSVYQLAVPPVPGLPPLAISVIVPGRLFEQLADGDEVATVGAADGAELIVSVTGPPTAVQPLLLVTVTV
jgi:hypothetical protein